MHQNVTVRGNKSGTTKVYTELREVNRHFREELPVNLHVDNMSMGENLQTGHGTVPDQGYVDPLMGGGNYRHKIAHQPVPQFFSGSGGAMPENLGLALRDPLPTSYIEATL